MGQSSAFLRASGMPSECSFLCQDWTILDEDQFKIPVHSEPLPIPLCFCFRIWTLSQVGSWKEEWYYRSWELWISMMPSHSQWRIGHNVCSRAGFKLLFIFPFSFSPQLAQGFLQSSCFIYIYLLNEGITDNSLWQLLSLLFMANSSTGIFTIVVIYG